MTVEPARRPVERKFAGVVLEDVEADGAFSGYASLFGKVDLSRDAVEPGAFLRSLRRRGPESVRMLFQHDPNQPIGRWMTIREDARGLYVRGRLTPGVARSREVLALMRSGALDGLSIGFRTVRARKDAGTGVRRILEADLWEISVVTFPMLPDARIDRVKGTGPAGMTRVRRDIVRQLRGEAAALRQAGLAERFRQAAQTLQTEEEDRFA